MARDRITKFNPSKRDGRGIYLDDSEWTAMSDIGKAKYNYLTYADYKKVEDEYVEAVKTILLEKEIDFLKIASIEFHDWEANAEERKGSGRFEDLVMSFEEMQSLCNGTQLTLDKLPVVIRLILREILWMVLVNGKLKIEFGYDYYVYINCDKLMKSSIEQMEMRGLFVEKLI